MKVQCKECLSYWSAGIVCCTCGHLLKEIVANRGFIEYTLDFLSIPEYVIKKGRPHGHRCGKKEVHRDPRSFLVEKTLRQSIINNGLIPGGQNSSTRRTVIFLPVDPMDKNHKDLDTIDLNEPRHAQYMHKAWKKHQNTVYWVDINLALKKRLKFYQTRSNAIILHETLPVYCTPKAVRMETGEVKNEKVCASPRAPPKISLKHDWMKELCSEDAQRPEGQVVQQSNSSQSNQPNPNPDHDRTGTPVVCRDASHAQGARKTSRCQEIESRSFREEAVKHDRTGTPVVCRDASHAQGHEQSMLNEVNIDFGILGLPHSVVKQAENSRVRELVKKIENHPHRHSLQ